MHFYVVDAKETIFDSINKLIRFDKVSDSFPEQRFGERYKSLVADMKREPLAIPLTSPVKTKMYT